MKPSIRSDALSCIKNATFEIPLEPKEEHDNNVREIMDFALQSFLSISVTQFGLETGSITQIILSKDYD